MEENITANNKNNIQKKKPLKLKSAFNDNGGLDAVGYNDIILNKEVIQNIKIVDIINPPIHDRKSYSRESIEELSKNIMATGKILQPVVLRLVEGKLIRVCGFRRIEAAKLLTWETVPAIVLKNISDEMASLIMISENFQREDINIYDSTYALIEYLSIALGYNFEDTKRLLFRFRNYDLGRYKDPLSDTENEDREKMEKILAKIGKITVATMCNRLKIFSLKDNILEALKGGKVSYVVALELNKFSDLDEIDELIERIKNDELSLKDIKEMLRVKKEKTMHPGEKQYTIETKDNNTIVSIHSLSKSQLNKLEKFLLKLYKEK